MAGAYGVCAFILRASCTATSYLLKRLRLKLSKLKHWPSPTNTHHFLAERDPKWHRPQSTPLHAPFSVLDNQLAQPKSHGPPPPNYIRRGDGSWSPLALVLGAV